MPHELQSSRLTSVADVVPIRQVGDPPDVTVPENCTKTESFAHEFLSALPRIHRWYGTPACAVNVISK